MKKLLLVILCLAAISCATKNNKVIHENRIINEINDSLNLEEIHIVNDLLETELESEKYKNYKKFEILLIEEIAAKLESLLTYEFAYKEWHSFETNTTKEDNQRLGWILNSIQIKEMKKDLIKQEKIIWKVNNIKNYKVSLIKSKIVVDKIKSGDFLKESEKLILRITRPLLLDEKNAFVSFRISSSHFGKSITNGTFLMIKKDNKWIIKNSYDDGVYE